ncbi:unnamed protein product [Withania somnifera]
MEKLRPFKSISPVQHLHRANSPRHPIEEHLSNNGITDENSQSAISKIYRDSSYDAAMKRMKDSNKDVDFVTGSPFSLPSLLSTAEESFNHGGLPPTEVRVSFKENLTGSGQVPRRSSSSFRRKSNLLAGTRAKVTMKSGVLRKSGEWEDNDPFSDDDLPEEYKKMKFRLFSVLQMVSLILVIAAFVCNLAIRKFKEKNFFGLALWKWELMGLVMICGRLTSGWGIRLAVFLIERNFILRKRVLYFAYGLRNSVQNYIWLSLVLLAWQRIFYKEVESVTNTKVLRYVSRIWVCLMLGTFVWLLKTLLVKALATSFHVTTFFDRIQEALFTQYVIESCLGRAKATLPPDLKASIFPKRPIGIPRNSTAAATSRSSPAMSRAPSRKEKEEQGGITIVHQHRMNQKNVSAWNMKRLTSIVWKGVLSTLDKQLQQSYGDDEAAVKISSEKQAKVAAKKVFINLAKPAGSKFICLEDITCFMREDETLRTMQLFEGGTEAKGISKCAKLHQMLNVLVGVIILFVWLLILKVATTQFLVFMSSQVLLVVFMFGNTAKTTFEAIIFLFVMHPFDVGDHVEIDGVHVIYPNSIFSSKPIGNFYLSPDMGDAIDFCIHISTPMEKIASMKERIKRYIANKSDHWYTAPLVVMRDVEDLNRINMGERWERRAVLVEAMVKIFRELDIEYRMLPVDVNVRNMPRLSSSGVPSNWSVCA